MKEKILLGFAVTLTIIVIVLRFEYSKALSSFETEISAYENRLANQLTADKIFKVKLLKIQNYRLALKIDSQFSLSAAQNKKDTIFRYLYFKKVIRYNNYEIGYLECLKSKCEFEIEEEKVQNRILIEKAILVTNFGEETVKYWFDKLSDNKLLVREAKLTNCQKYFPNVQLTQFDESRWTAFKVFLTDYNKEKQIVEYQNSQEIIKLERLKESIKNQLYGDALSYFNYNLSQNTGQLLEEDVVEKKYNIALLGEINYSLKLTKFQKNKFDEIADNAFEIQWKTNSLRNGSMPYAYCYGAANSCYDYNCSQIKIINGGTDVIVLIKTSSDNVIRHAYIKAGYTFTFEVPNNTYNIFFYSGIGWNPNKVMSQSSCTIKGGFVQSESTGKDTYVTVNNNVLSYQLRQVVNGNFNMESSTKSEVFN